LSSKLSEWRDDIDTLKARAESTAGATRKEYRENVEALQAKRQDLEDRIHRLSQSAESAWEDMKVGVDAAGEALVGAIKSAKARFEAASAAGRRK
jgi:chromosome segregation ATPase